MAKWGGNNMLLEFSVSNYKSFVEEVVFKMTPTAKIHDLEYSLLKSQVGKKSIDALSSAIIYGPNASGKTNLIGAMEVFKSIVMRGHIRNVESNEGAPNIAKNQLELIPNIKSDKDKPVKFRIKFIKDNEVIEYFLGINLGKFLDIKAERKIYNEKLVISGKMIFDRNTLLEIGEVKSISKYLVKGFDSKAGAKLSKSNLNKQELFLTSMFKAVYSNTLANSIIEWFEKDLVIIYSSDKLHTKPIFGESKKNKNIYISDSLNSAMKEFGLTGNKLVYSQEDGKEPEPLSILEIENGKNIGISSDIFESFGSIRFMNIFPLIFSALRKGQTVIIDEFDASIHPMALMSLVNVFHNDEINKENAQLVFNTHNPIFLNRNLFRRDEIKFVERDEDTSESRHYSLADFGTSGPSGVRNTADYMKNYFISQYGAIRNIDFSDVFMKALEKVSEEITNENETE